MVSTSWLANKTINGVQAQKGSRDIMSFQQHTNHFIEIIAIKAAKQTN